MYQVYIVRCADKSLYTGITTDINRRIDQHNGLRPGGARYTQGRRPVQLAYCARYPDRSLASIEESRIKKLPTQEKNLLIKKQKI